MNCPNCDLNFDVSVFSKIPERQVLYLRLTGEGEMFEAKTVGYAMIHLADVQQEIAKAMGTSVSVFIQSVELQSGEIVIGFCIAENVKKPMAKDLKSALDRIYAVYGNDLEAFFSDAKASKLRADQSS